jgi:hypothetical protein
MKITKTRLKEIVKSAVISESEYKDFFQKALDKAGKSIPAMSDEEKKAFFNKIDAAWDAKGEKNETLVGNQHKLDVDGDGDIEGDDLADLRAGKKADESVTEDYDGPAIIKTGNKNSLKVGEKVTLNTNGKKREYKVVKSNGNGDFVVHLVKESVNEATLKPGTKLRYEKNNYVIDYVVDKEYKGNDGFTRYILKVVKSNYPNKIKVGSTEEYENSRLSGLIRNGVIKFVKNESVNEGKKVFKVNPGIGKAKYSISSHDGKKTHKDGSDFYDIEIFNNKVDLEKGIKKYTSNGFVKESVNEAKYPTDLRVGSVILGQGFTRLKGIEGGRYYKIVDMDDTTATLVPSDKNGNTKGSTKVRHKLDSIEGGIKTAKRGDENGIVVIKESVNEAKFKSPDYIISTTPASKLPPTRLAHADVSLGLKMAEKLKNYTLDVRHYNLIHANGKVALKLTPQGKTAVRVRTEDDPKYLQLIQKTVNDIVADYVSKIKESVNEGKLNEEAKPILKPGTKVKLRGGKSGKIVRFDGKTPGSPFYIVDIGQYYSIEVPAYELETESVNEGVSSADMDKIKGAVEAAKSFMNVGAELKKLGMKYTFATEPLPIYIIQPTPNNRVAIVNKKYVSKPDFVVGDIAVGIMEGKSVTEATHSDAPGQWVGFLSNQHGKKLMGTLKSATEAKKWLTRNQNYILSRFKADSVGIMTKKQWDEREAKYAFESVNEIASRTAMEIGALTGTNKDFIQNFVDKNELDIEKVFQYVKKGKLKDRMDFVTAVVGKPNNPFQVKLIKQFKK